MNNKGFITIYGVLLLNLLLPFTTMLLESVKTSYLYHQDNTLNFVEIQVINKVKNSLVEYEEEDEIYTFLDYQVTLQYEDITCYISIHKQNDLKLSSVLVFDDIEEEIVSYTYLNENGA